MYIDEVIVKTANSVIKMRNMKHFTFRFNKFGQGLTDQKTYNNIKVDYVYWNNPNELNSRLKLLIAS